MQLEAWNFAQTFLKVYTYHSWHQKSSRLHSGIKNVLQDSLEDVLETRRRICSFSAAIGPEISHRASLLFIYVTPDVQSHLKSIKESKMSSKTPWRILWRLKGKCPLPVYLLVWNFVQNFLDIYKCHSWQPKSSRLQSGIKNFLQVSLKEALDPHRRMSSSSEPRGLTFCTEI